MKSCDKKLRNKKNLKLFLAGSAMLLLASCSSAPVVLNNPVDVQDEVVKKVQPRCSVVDDSGSSNPSFIFVFPEGTYLDEDGLSVSITAVDILNEDTYLTYLYYVALDGNDAEFQFNVNAYQDADEDTGLITISCWKSYDANLTSYDYVRMGFAVKDSSNNTEFVFPSHVFDSLYFDSYYSTENGWYLNENVSAPPLGVTFVQDIVEILVSGITNLGTALGQGISTTAQAMFINASNDGLSVWGVLVASFAGLALAVGLTRLVFGFITSLGGKN